MAKQKIINIAVIAHVDAGKSTLVDAFLNQSGVFKPNEEVGELIMDSNESRSIPKTAQYSIKIIR